MLLCSFTSLFLLLYTKYKILRVLIQCLKKDQIFLSLSDIYFQGKNINSKQNSNKNKTFLLHRDGQHYRPLDLLQFCENTQCLHALLPGMSMGVRGFICYFLSFCGLQVGPYKDLGNVFHLQLYSIYNTEIMWLISKQKTSVFSIGAVEPHTKFMKIWYQALNALNKSHKSTHRLKASWVQLS